MQKTKHPRPGIAAAVAMRALTATAFAVVVAIAMMLHSPITASADNTARLNGSAANTGRQHAPQYQFENTFPYNQWGRPTTSNVAPQHTQNIRRDRHSAVIPPIHGVQTGFFSGEFPTERANPFAPRYNNNPAASRAVAIEESVFATRPGETGVNVRADGTHAGGFLASTSVTQGSGGNNSAAPHGEPAGGADAPWEAPGAQAGQGGVTVTHTPMPEQAPQTGNRPGQAPSRITAVEPFGDGTIGRITIPALNNRTASVRHGVEPSTLNNYVGHFTYTSQWDGTVALASHNRGRGSFFAGIWTLRNGDRIIYETTMGTRVYEVVSITQISETDLSNLNHSHENSLVLVTCVYGSPALRWSVRAVEVA